MGKSRKRELRRLTHLSVNFFEMCRQAIKTKSGDNKSRAIRAIVRRIK